MAPKKVTKKGPAKTKKAPAKVQPVLSEESESEAAVFVAPAAKKSAANVKSSKKAAQPGSESEPEAVDDEEQDSEIIDEPSANSTRVQPSTVIDEDDEDADDESADLKAKNTPAASSTKNPSNVNQVRDDEEDEEEEDEPNRPPAKKKPKFKNAETTFPPGRLLRELKNGNYADRVQKSKRQTCQQNFLLSNLLSFLDAAVYMSAVLDYLVDEVFEGAKVVSDAAKKVRITPRHLMISVKRDDEINMLLKDVTFPSVGVMSKIHPVLLPKKTAPKRKASGAE